MGNPQLIRREGQHHTIETSKMVMVQKTDDIKALEEAGHHFVHLPIQGGSDMVWRSLVPDGYIREITSNWDKEMQPYPYELDALKWRNNVTKWFENALLEPSYVELIEKAITFNETNYTAEDIVRKASEYMATQRPSRPGRTGPRRADIDRWFRTDKNSYISKNKRPF